MILRRLACWYLNRIGMVVIHCRQCARCPNCGFDPYTNSFTTKATQQQARQDDLRLRLSPTILRG